jgi:hypothetical protein
LVKGVHSDQTQARILDIEYDIHIDRHDQAVGACIWVAMVRVVVISIIAEDYGFRLSGGRGLRAPGFRCLPGKPPEPET